MFNKFVKKLRNEGLVASREQFACLLLASVSIAAKMVQAAAAAAAAAAAPAAAAAAAAGAAVRNGRLSPCSPSPQTEC